MLSYPLSSADTVRPMLELIWAPLLGCFSLLFDEYSDPRLLAICLAGFGAATCLAAHLGVSNLRDVFVNSLCNFTHLHSQATMKPKNGMAFKTLITVALQVGNHLDERWVCSWACRESGKSLLLPSGVHACLAQNTAVHMPCYVFVCTHVCPGNTSLPGRLCRLGWTSLAPAEPLPLQCAWGG